MTKITVTTLTLILALPVSAANLQWNNVGSNYSNQPTYTAPTIYTNIGEQTFGSDGSRATRIGNQTIIQDSNGNHATCTQIGQQVFCR